MGASCVPPSMYDPDFVGGIGFEVRYAARLVIVRLASSKFLVSQKLCGEVPLWGHNIAVDSSCWYLHSPELVPGPHPAKLTLQLRFSDRRLRCARPLTSGFLNSICCSRTGIPANNLREHPIKGQPHIHSLGRKPPKGSLPPSTDESLVRMCAKL